MLENIFGGIDVYHFVCSFIVYSVLGWFVESVYMSFCNKKLTNRGFMFLPFCPIYGFGATLGYMLLSPLAAHPVILYFVSAITATVFEFLVGKVMIRIFGELWWDYNNKPLNFQGIICLESTIAWGFYGLGVVLFLNGWIMNLIEMVPMHIGVTICKVVLAMVSIDFIYHVLCALGVSIREYKDKVVEKYKEFRARWY